MIEEAAASELKATPLSDNTSARHIHDISKNNITAAG